VSRCALPAALVAVLLCASDATAQGSLRRIHAAIHPGPKYFLPATGDGNGNWLGIDPAYQTSAGTGLGLGAVGLGIAAVGLATSPFWGPHELFDAGFDQRGWFPPYPYALDDRPYMVIGDCPNVPTQGDDYLDPHHVKPWAVRLSVEGGNDFDNLTRLSGQLFLDTSVYRLGFLANWTYYAERVPGGTEEALMADYNLTWRVTQSERLLMHIGAGLRTWTMSGHTDPGFNVLYRADVFPLSSMHVAGVFEAGTLQSALVLHGQVQAGWTFGHGELFIGYDLLRVKRVSLHGPAVGLRLWF
jgi:hypothetical protein